MATATMARPARTTPKAPTRALAMTAGVSSHTQQRRRRRRYDDDDLNNLEAAAALPPPTPGPASSDDDLADDLSVEALYRRDLLQYELLTQAQVNALYVRMRRRGADGAADDDAKAAREAMICANLRLVITIAKSYAHTTRTPLGDLIAEGNIGLMRAVEKYRPELGFSFGTYAGWWIRQAITRQACNDGIIHLPEHVRQARNAIRRTRRRLQVELGCEPTDADVEAAIRPEQLRNLTFATAAYLPETPASLDKPLPRHGGKGAEADVSWADKLPDPDPSPEEIVTERAADGDLAALLGTVLTAREATLIRLRFGLGGLGSEGGSGSGEHSLLETGKRLGISRERVRQLEQRALEKLRAALGAEGLAALAAS